MYPAYNAQRSSKVHVNVFHFLVKHFVFQHASSSVALKLFSQCSLLDVIEEAEINIINNAWRWRLHDQYCEVVEYLTSSLHGNLHSWLILTNNILEDYWFPLCCGFNNYFYQHLTAFQTWLVIWYFSNCPDNKTLSRNSLNGNWLQLRWKRLHKYRQPCTLPYNLNL